MSTMNPSAMLAESLAEFSKSAYAAFTEIENKARQDVAHALQETRDAKTQRDEAINDLHSAQLEAQSWKQEAAASKATLTQAELTITHQAESFAAQVEQIAQLRREVSQWKDQSRNWQEHFLRVEQERCAQSSRLDELVIEKLQYIRPPTSSASYITPKPSKYNNQISSAPSTTVSKHTIPSPTQPPAYRAAETPMLESDPSLLRNNVVQSASANPNPGSASRNQKTTTKLNGSNRRERTRQQDAQNDIEEIAPPPNKKAKKNATEESHPASAAGAVASGSRQHYNGVSAQSQHASSSAPQVRSSTVLRRVHAVVHVKREDTSDDEGAGALSTPGPAGPSRTSGQSASVASGKTRRKDELDDAGETLLTHRRKGVNRGRSQSKRVMSEDEDAEEGEDEEDRQVNDEESNEGSRRTGSDQTPSQGDSVVDSEERGDTDGVYNLRKPSRPNYREEDAAEDDEDDVDELMLGAEDNHEELYATYPVDSSRRNNPSPRKKRKFSGR